MDEEGDTMQAMADAIVTLTLENHQLQRDLVLEQQITTNLRAESNRIMEEMGGYLKKEYIAQFVRDCFYSGAVPLPRHLWNRERPVDVHCTSDDISFHSGVGFVIKVTFVVGGGSSFVVNFRMSLSNSLEAIDAYPNFVPCSWDGPKPTISARKKVEEKK